MNEKNMHGRVFKKLREERGYKLKDVARDVISTRTLTRFENDETSLSITTFEKLLENCGVSYLDFLAYYYDNTEIENINFANRMQSHLQTETLSIIVDECKKELYKNNRDLNKKLSALMLIDAIGCKDEIELNDDNKKLMKENIELTNKIGWNEIVELNILVNSASRDDYSVEYIDSIIQECLINIPTRNYLSIYKGTVYSTLLNALLDFLFRYEYYDLAEKRCKEALKIYNEHAMLLNQIENSIEVTEILAKVYMCQNKKEGIELANKILKYRNSIMKITDSPFYKQKMDISYKTILNVNKTESDIKF
ncbi:helix-turn-helix transcriptional regulator [uncultured Gemella sp.]|uniref:helix-turn-helix domain-containing protein n=1 Tax=uncultured Gemella sp. TaxID=254352 RepID=UPI0025DD83EB|nr:helix-turn-helix transcriptional regulator [uncultured Gemella sp.]